MSRHPHNHVMSDSDDDFLDFDIGVGIGGGDAACASIITPFETDALFNQILENQQAEHELNERLQMAQAEYQPERGAGPSNKVSRGAVYCTFHSGF